MLLPNQHLSLSAKSTKEDTGKSKKNVLYVLRYAKGMCPTEVMLNSEKTSL